MNDTHYGKMSEAELSKKLGQYQKQARIWTIIGLIGVLGGVISFFAVDDMALKLVLTAVLFFGGVCAALFLGGSAQKKLKALMQDQMGDFFRAELENAFGPDMNTAQMRIDEKLVRSLVLLDNQWEEIETENFREGEHNGVHFSVANVRLNHVYERGAPQDGLETCRDMVFKGIVLRLEMRTIAAENVLVSARTEDSPRGIATGSKEFDRCFCVTAEHEQYAKSVLTPQLTERILEFCRGIDGQLLGFCLSGSTLSMAVETDYAFAGVASSVDLRDLDALRRSYVSSLHEMGGIIDLLTENSELFAV